MRAFGETRRISGELVLRSRSALRPLLAALLLAACAPALEPAYDARIVDRLEGLSAANAALFARPAPAFAVADHPERREIYADLAARAATVALLAEARPRPSGRAARALSGLLPGAPAAEEDDAYAAATVGFMADYRRNLDRLAERDRERFETLSAQAETARAEQRGHVRAARAYAEAYARWLAGDGPRPAPLRTAPPGPGPALSANFVERRRLQMTDALRDALVYEGAILDRGR